MVQLAVDGNESVADRIERAMWLTNEATQSADMVVLPELWPTGAFDLELGVEHAQPINGPLVQALATLAADTATWIHGGSFVEKADKGRLFNTSVMFAQDGTFAAIYRKIHLFGFDAGEAAILNGGDDVVVVHTPLGLTGLATCYDLRFPELFREMTERGASAVLLSSGWPLARIARWNILAQARAMENQLWFIGCNETGTHGDVTLGGNSIVTDPWGDVTFQADEGEGIFYVDIDPKFATKVRADFPVLRDRKL